MNAEQQKVQEFLSRAKNLLTTSMQMEDIFRLTMNDNSKQKAAIYINDKGKTRSYKYSKMKKHAYQFASIIAHALYQEKKGKPIVLKLANCPRWGELFWAILMSGYKPLLIDAKTSKEGTQNLINQAKAIAIITDDAYEYDVLKITLNEFIENRLGQSYSFAPSWENEVIFCSSGTTGDVKLMVFNGFNLCHQICESLEMGNTTKDLMYPKSMGKIHILAMIPFHHIFGFVAVFLWFSFYGKTLVYPSSMSAAEIQKICQKNKVSHIFSVPLFWDSLALNIERKAALETPTKQKLFNSCVGYRTGKLSREEAGQGASNIVRDTIQRGLLGTSVRYCISGGGYLNSKTATIINGVGYNLYNGYGMTEVGVTSVELSPEVEIRLKGSIGKPLYGVEYKIKNPDKKHQGELLVKSNTIHVREIIAGEERDTEFDKEGYFATGDIALKDASNNYYIKGRIKDIIINSDGENIFPDELELFFKKIEGIKNLCVLGVAIKASQNEDVVLVLEVDNSISDEDLKRIETEVKEVGQHLPKGTKISKIYLSRNRLPLANNMKVKRFVIKKAIESKSSDYILLGAKKEAKKFEGFDEATIKSILEPMRDIFSKILVLPKFKIEDNAHWINDLGGDSMNYVELVLKVQDTFQVTIPEELYGQLTCINDFVEEVAKLKKGK